MTKEVPKKIAKKAAAMLYPFLKVVTDFSEEVINERGEVESATGTGHSHIISELFNFGVFSFRTDMGQTTMGGNEVKIWYHPGGRYKEGMRPVIDVWWKNDITKAELRSFLQDEQWQYKILDVIRNHRTALDTDRERRQNSPSFYF